MITTETELYNAYIIDLKKKEDERGFFTRSFCEKKLLENGISFQIAQVNISYNDDKHTLRGMHYQADPYGEAKLVRCPKGAIFDVIIDLRVGSPTFMEWTGIELTEQNLRMLYVPEGFAHGFITLEDETEVVYLMSEFYKPEAGRGVRWNDPAFAIDWPATPKVISDKDKSWPDFKKRHQIETIC
jgi:dTDP-4-dehydrorhamnose 3,5-epimerase